MVQRSLHNRVTSRSMKQLFDEWQIGFRMTDSISEQAERDLIDRLRDDHTGYLDYFFTDYDHIAHLDNEEASAVEVLKRLDALVGRLWNAIQKSGRADETIFVLVSDHGMNSDPQIISQGYNLIRLFNAGEGGAHHVITNRHPLSEYKLRGLDPFVSEVTSPSSESLNLPGEAYLYPTALLDLDGNERASVSLRNSDVNRLHMLLRSVAGDAAARHDALALLDRFRPSWTRTLAEIDEELAAWRRAIDRQRSLIGATPAKESKSDNAHKRERAFLEIWARDEGGYRAYADWLRRITTLRPRDLESQDPRLGALMPGRVMGEHNTIHQLQNYAAGPAKIIDYFALLSGLRVRNNVQQGVTNAPVDFIAAGIQGLEHASVFVHGDAEHQALLFSKEENGKVLIRYQPVAHLKQDSIGAVTFEERRWAAGFPLKIFEDPDADITGDRAVWLSQWHSDREWLRATHRTLYSNGIVGLIEHFAPIRVGPSRRCGATPARTRPSSSVSKRATARWPKPTS